MYTDTERIHISHFKRAPAPDWTTEGAADLKHTLKQCSNRGRATLTPGQEGDNIRSRCLPKILDPIRMIIYNDFLTSWISAYKSNVFYHGHSPMLVLKISPILGFVSYQYLILLITLMDFSTARL